MNFHYDDIERLERLDLFNLFFGIDWFLTSLGCKYSLYLVKGIYQPLPLYPPHPLNTPLFTLQIPFLPLFPLPPSPLYPS